MCFTEFGLGAVAVFIFDESCLRCPAWLLAHICGLISRVGQVLHQIYRGSGRHVGTLGARYGWNRRLQTELLHSRINNPVHGRVDHSAPHLSSGRPECSFGHITTAISSFKGHYTHDTEYCEITLRQRDIVRQALN